LRQVSVKLGAISAVEARLYQPDLKGFLSVLIPNFPFHLGQNIQK